MLMRKKGQSEKTERIEIGNDESIRRLEEKENDEYFGILEADKQKSKSKKSSTAAEISSEE